MPGLATQDGVLAKKRNDSVSPTEDLFKGDDAKQDSLPRAKGGPSGRPGPLEGKQSSGAEPESESGRQLSFGEHFSRPPGETSSSASSSPRAFEYSGGIHLCDSVLWCDADRKRDLSFISHAHAGYTGKSRRILATDKTLRILTRASGKVEALTSPYRRSFTLGALELEMHPAGHVLGSAQLLITCAGRRLVYTSDFSPHRGHTREPAYPIPCDVLVVPATYGLPIYRFPPQEEVLASLCQFIDRCLESHSTPVLIANQIGTAQELIHGLGSAGYQLRVHRSIYDIARIYRGLGVDLPAFRRFQGSHSREDVVIFPPILKKHASIRSLKNPVTAMVTGRAIEEGFLFRHRVDAAFPFSDTADHQDLITFVKATGAREVYLTGGYVDEFGAELRNLGSRVHTLVPPKQLPLF